MSELIVKKSRIWEIQPHGNADRMEVAIIGGRGGWEVCVPKGTFTQGEEALFVPVDALVPPNLAKEWGVAPYLGKGGRVRAAKLRGRPSFGFLVKGDWPDGNLANELGIGKYEPPPEISSGDAEKNDPFFHEYTKIQHLKHFPDKITEGELCIITEKIHGRNARFGLVNQEFMIGSHIQRKKIDSDCIYGIPSKDPNVQKALQTLYEQKQAHSVILFYEIFGLRIQDLTYGRKNVDYAVFDISVDGRYMDWPELVDFCRQWTLPMVPILYEGPFGWDKIKEYVDGPTTVEGAGQTHIREGIVIRPVKESSYQDHAHVYRRIFKYLSVDYLTRKGKQTEYH